MEQDLVAHLKQVPAISFTTDGSSFYNNMNYIAFTGHFIHNWNMRSVLLGFSFVEESETAKFISTKLEDVFSHRQVTGETTAIITDNDANVLVATQNIVNKQIITEKVQVHLMPPTWSINCRKS